MLDLLISPFAKILAAIGLVILVFGFGYYKGYSGEKQKFNDYKAGIDAQVKTQELVNQQLIKRQDIVTKGIQNEYKAKITRLESLYGGVQYRSSAAVSPTTNTTSRINEETKNLVLDCAVTTQQLMSLQDWLNAQQQAK